MILLFISKNFLHYLILISIRDFTIPLSILKMLFSCLSLIYLLRLFRRRSIILLSLLLIFVSIIHKVLILSTKTLWKHWPLLLRTHSLSSSRHCLLLLFASIIVVVGWTWRKSRLFQIPCQKNSLIIISLIGQCSSFIILEWLHNSWILRRFLFRRSHSFLP